MNKRVEFCGMVFENPILPASGPLVEGLENLKSMDTLPLGGIVTKTISVEGADVKKPCIVGTKHMVFNTELWSEHDLAYWVKVLPGFVAQKTKPLGISIGYTAEDFQVTVPQLDPYADFFEVSTHYNKATLSDVVKSVTALTKKPVFIKMSPHITDEAAFVNTVLAGGARGIVAFNSFGPGAVIDLKRRALAIGSGGDSWVSGPAIKPFALRRIARLRAMFPDLPIIGCGGVETAEDVLEMVLAGADLVQMLSSALLKGRGLYQTVVEDLDRVMQACEIDSVASLRQTPLEMEAKGRGHFPVVDKARCTSCGICVRICPFTAYEMHGKPLLSAAKCIRCGLCESMCPVGAISEVLS